MVAEKNKKIHIISTRGMLQPWALNHKSWRKKLAGYLYEISAATYQGDDIRVCAIGGIRDGNVWKVAIINRHPG